MTPQQLFDTALIKVLEQGKASVDEDGQCLYRSPEGSKCAIGHLLTDEEYCDELEGHEVNNLRLLDRLPDRLTKHWRLLNDIQFAHDQASDAIGDFKQNYLDRMTTVAREFQLNIPETAIRLAQ